MVTNVSLFKTLNAPLKTERGLGRIVSQRYN